MKLVVLGLSLSSSWGNGHATTYRALLRAYAERGHDILFLERDVSWYADARDLAAPDFSRLAFYADLPGLHRWGPEVASADAVIVGSYVPDGVAVGDWVHRTARKITAFYDIDTPVTLAALARGEKETYLAPRQIARYDLYLSFTGGPTLDRLQRHYRSPMARALYCSADPALYRPTPSPPRWDLSYLGTYSPDRQPALDRLLLEPARLRPDLRFVVAGPQYPDTIRWPDNVARIPHVAPADHAAFYGASRYTLNVTRADMVAAGWSPSVRLFEAGACRTAIISDFWSGLDALFGPGEVDIAHTTADVLRSLDAPEPHRRNLAEGAHRRIHAAHTAAHRAAELEAALAEARVPFRVRA